MSTPDTVGTINHCHTPFNNSVLLATRAAEQQTTASTVRFGPIVTWTSEDGANDVESDELPTLEACSLAITTAAERMVALTGQPHSLAVAIAYDECLDIVTAAVDHMEHIGLQGELSENVIDVYLAIRSIRELLRPSPPVRRALQF
ncbi:hypothetical protein GN244_ATG11840 [Phytophthora infestans]|uniref:Uncharacterized protein n=1 Tax=Phytophthora infestans TaxID=4787 RepID=A0A833RZF4_PHYIN|nr:hypothetical protein GN244_ATG11840 [Phytophthora infestans]KAF4141755.1 hypothetical protein GN958_ATG09085 [Phytophthora infestans]KAI9992369.1 hypothetical protein PInf_017770 [Phytophthora infestans]KAI9992476.1 hypothetical protein PInf_017889 [Phytophthora infestans]